VIESWRDRKLRDFFVDDKPVRKLPADIRDRLFVRLQILDDATCDADLRVPPSNHFEKLSGELAGWHSLRVNAQWRIVFRWNGSVATDVYLDNHEYR